MELFASLMGTTVRAVHEARCPETGPVCQLPNPPPPHLHDQRIHLLQLTLFGEYRPVDPLLLRLEVPLRLSRTTITYRRMDGVPFEPEWTDIHHRDETLAGPGDPLVLVGWRGTAGEAPSPWRFVARGGTSLPLGRTEPNPFAAALRGEPHQHLQFGAGTVMPTVELGVAKPLGALTVDLTGRAMFGVAQNRHGYRPGHRFAGTLSVSRALTASLDGALLFDAWGELPERWDGQVREEGNLGRSDVLVGAMVRARVGPVPVSLTARLPVWHHSAESTVSYPAVVELGVSWSPPAE